MPKLPAHSTVALATAKSSRKDNSETSLPREMVKKEKKPRSLTQILSLNQTAVAIVDRDLAESQLAISSIINSTSFSLVDMPIKQQKHNAKKPKKRLSLVKSRH